MKAHMKIASLIVFLSSSTIAACGVAEKSKSSVRAETVPSGITAEGKDGVDGKDGKDGKDGAPGKDGKDGAGLLRVFAGPVFLGYYLGSREVVFTSGAIGVFNFTTGDISTVPGAGSFPTCFYSADDCSGVCFFNATDSAPMPGYTFFEGKKLWRIDGDEPVTENPAIASYRFGASGACRTTSAISIDKAITPIHAETVPAGLSAPFGKLTIKK